MFAYIRRKVAAAVLAGFADALETLEAESTPSPLPLPESLRLRLEGREEEPESGKVKTRSK